jgi:acetyl-CoA carboxylase biotin carboxyl carrier protein
LSHENLTYEDLLRIVELIKSSEQFSEFRLKIGEIEIELRRRLDGTSPAAARESRAATARESAPAETSSTESAHAERERDDAALAGAPAQGRSAPQIDAGTIAAWPAGSIVVRAPMVGTFYRAPEPGTPPFVEVGQAVEPDTTVCIIEVMKLMNSIPAGVRGVVARVLVEDGAPVDTDAPLIVVDPVPTSE